MLRVSRNDRKVRMDWIGNPDNRIRSLKMENWKTIHREEQIIDSSQE